MMEIIWPTFFCRFLENQSRIKGISTLRLQMTHILSHRSDGIPWNEMWQRVDSVQTSEALLSLRVNNTM